MVLYFARCNRRSSQEGCATAMYVCAAWGISQKTETAKPLIVILSDPYCHPERSEGSAEALVVKPLLKTGLLSLGCSAGRGPGYGRCRPLWLSI